MEIGKINFGPIREPDFIDVALNISEPPAWPVRPANVAESSSPMPGLSPKQGLEDYLTRLDQKSDKLAELLIAMTGQMQAMAVNQKEMGELLSHIVQTLAEDQDPDEMPATYMDGTPV